jgi:tRNA(Ile)-lysidine synthase
VSVQGLAFIDDPTNADTRFTRNRLRHDLMPVMTRAFPSMVEALGRTARHCAEANQLLQALAQQDLLTAGQPPKLAHVQSLPAARQANLLRQWLVEEAGRAPSTAQLDELRKQIAAATTRGHRIHLRVGSGWVQRQGNVLVFMQG